ncbi:MAG: hypothetical protein DRN81_04085 [Thermoproteota archaeon]|nr:MAG: hypothetical protein DRN81_04085 [Candidatus Korarchaeota archaeon]
MYDKKRNSQIISDVIKEFDKGHKCLVISSRKEHCEILFKILKEKVKGVSVVTGDYSRKVVQERINIFSRKRIPQIMVATFDLIGEGFDVPDIDRAFLALPLRSDARIKQLIGRIQRPSPGKKDAILFDYVDSGVGVLVNQFKGRKQCRYRSYMDLGINVRNI